MPHGNAVLARRRLARISNWCGSAGAIGTQYIRPQIDRYQPGLRWSPTPPLTFGVYESAPQRESNQFSQQHHSLEAQRYLLSVCVSGRCVPCRESFLYLHCRREQSLPYENSKSKGPGVCGNLPKTLHGALVAAPTVVRASSTSWYVNKPRSNYEQLQFRPGIT